MNSDIETMTSIQESPSPVPPAPPLAQNDTAGTPVLTDLETYELGQALRQIYATEQKLRKELRDAKHKAELVSREVSTQQDSFDLRTRQLEGEISELKRILGSREDQIKELLEKETLRGGKDAEEKRYLSKKAEEAATKYEQMVRQHDELYRYCENLLKESETRRRKTETEVSHASEQKELYQHRIQELEVATANLTGRLEEAKSALEQASKGASLAHFEASQMEARYRATYHILELTHTQLTRGKDVLVKTLKAMDEMQKAGRGYFEDLEAEDIAPLTVKAGLQMTDQWRLETDHLRKLAALLTELIDRSQVTRE